MRLEARTAALGGTRQMIADAQFAALVATLVDCRAIPANVMGAMLERLAENLIAKARGELESEFAVYPAELFDRARALRETAAAIGG